MLRPLIALVVLLEAATIIDPRVASAAPTQTRSAGEECFTAYEGAQSSRRSGKLVRSKSELAACISVCPAALQNDCKAWLTDVEAKLPRLSVVARGAGGEDLSSFEVEVDGAAWTSPVDVELDPGAHVVRVSAAGRRPAERRVVLGSGKQSETFLLEPDARAATARAATDERPSVGPWVLGGAGGVMLLAAGTLSLVGWMDFDDMKDTCAPGCPNERVDGLRTKWVAGGILAAGGALALGGAVVWRIFGGRSEPATVRVGPGVVQLTGRF